MSEPTSCKNEEDCTSPVWCAGKSVCEKVANQQLAKPMTDEERQMDRRALDRLHPGNRFRLMFGQPLLPQNNQ